MPLAFCSSSHCLADLPKDLNAFRLTLIGTLSIAQRYFLSRSSSLTLVFCRKAVHTERNAYLLTEFYRISVIWNP